MLTTLEWVYFALILLCAFIGGYFPLFRPDQARSKEGFPHGEAFSSGVFLALALVMLLPSASVGFSKALPTIEYPIAAGIALVAFVLLLGAEHLTTFLVGRSLPEEQGSRIPAIIPIIMTAMIAMPSFFLGAALGMSDHAAALLILLAIVLHKSTAGFALALAMTRSTLTRGQALTLFTCFAFMTPLGLLAGGIIRAQMTDSATFVRATVLALGAGTFLFMGTLHEMKRASLIEHCCRLSCFLYMLAGMSLTALVRWIVGEAHHF